jgi:hypothetical protein
MPNEILSKYSGSAVTLSMTLNGLVDGDGQQATRVSTGTYTPTQQVRISGNIVTGAAPTANTLVEFYIARGDDSGISDGDVGPFDAGWGVVAGVIQPTQTTPMVEFVFALVVTATANNPYQFSFMVNNPGTNFVLICMNQTGDALNAANNEMHYRYVTPEIQ